MTTLARYAELLHARSPSRPRHRLDDEYTDRQRLLEDTLTDLRPGHADAPGRPRHHSQHEPHVAPPGGTAHGLENRAVPPFHPATSTRRRGL